MSRVQVVQAEIRLCMAGFVLLGLEEREDLWFPLLMLQSRCWCSGGHWTGEAPWQPVPFSDASLHPISTSTDGSPPQPFPFLLALGIRTPGLSQALSAALAPGPWSVTW